MTNKLQYGALLIEEMLKLQKAKVVPKKELPKQAQQQIDEVAKPERSSAATRYGELLLQTLKSLQGKKAAR